jgi:hypothetical protein
MKMRTKMNPENTDEIKTDRFNGGVPENFVGTEIVLIRLVGYTIN